MANFFVILISLVVALGGFVYGVDSGSGNLCLSRQIDGS
jgi:hypothetical protein